MKLAPLLFGLATLIFIAASPAHAAEGKFKVVTTFTVIADMARNVAGDIAIVESITKPGAEIHGYQPTPGDILRGRMPTSSYGMASISNSGSSSSSPI